MQWSLCNLKICPSYNFSATVASFWGIESFQRVSASQLKGQIGDFSATNNEMCSQAPCLFMWYTCPCVFLCNMCNLVPSDPRNLWRLQPGFPSFLRLHWFVELPLPHSGWDFQCQPADEAFQKVFPTRAHVHAQVKIDHTFFFFLSILAQSNLLNQFMQFLSSVVLLPPLRNRKMF